jgi:hypothetical protein
VERITQFLAALTGAVTFVYLVGAGVLWTRLYREELPKEAVITSLPRELLLSVGIRTIFLPMLIFAVLAASVLALFLIAHDSGPSGRGTRKATIMQLRILGGLVAVAGILLFVLLGIFGPDWTWAAVWIGAGAAVLLMTTALYLFFDASPLVRFVAVVVVAALTGTVGRLILEIESQFEEVAVCVNDGGRHYSGLLIGETGNGVYVGIVDETPRHVIEVPRDRLSEVKIGTDASDDCPELATDSPAG